MMMRVPKLTTRYCQMGAFAIASDNTYRITPTPLSGSSILFFAFVVFLISVRPRLSLREREVLPL